MSPSRRWELWAHPYLCLDHRTHSPGPNCTLMSKSAKKKSRQRLGGVGGGLTLPAFVNAKSKPRLNPADLRKKSMQFENTKKIKKYKKLVKCLSHEEELSGGVGTERSTPVGSTSNGNGFQHNHTALFASKERHGHTKGMNALEALRKDYVKNKKEEDRLKAERLKDIKAKEEARSKVMQTRKNLKAKMFKRTDSGQPLMKHRLHHILESIQLRQ